MRLFSLIALVILATNCWTLEYLRTTGDDVTTEYYNTSMQEDYLVRTYQNSNEKNVNFINDLETLRLQVLDSENESKIEIYVSDERFIIAIAEDDSVSYKEMSKKPIPWYQSISYSVGQHFLNSLEDIKFYIFSSQKLNFYTMKAKFLGKEVINLNNNQINAIKVKVSASGLKAKFWHSFYWFRESDGLFLKYKGRNGPPGTPITTIELKEDNENQ